MGIPTNSSDRTYRVRGLPSNASIPESEKILSDLFDKDGQVTKPKIHSLGFDPSETEGSATKIATATFGHAPIELEEGNDWDFPVDYDRNPIKIDTRFLGFTPLNCDEDPKVDFIAISGLSSHPFGSWKARGGQFMWLRDHCAANTRGARVLLYGYDTKLVKSESFQNVDDIARRFCVDIGSIRRLKAGETNYEPRPIVFIAHSLGGLVVKEAICQMSSPKYLDDLLSVYGLVFFGVPNLGIRISHWLPMVENQPNENLINNLKPGSRYLAELQRKFEDVFRYARPKVVSVYENEKSKTAKEESPGHWSLTGETEILVTPESALGHFPPEINQEWIPFKREHSDLPKFSSSYDDDYKSLYGFIREFRDNSVKEIQERFSREAAKQESNNNTQIGGYYFTCRKCNKSFKSRILLFRHLKDPQKHECYQAAIHYVIANGQVGVANVLLGEESNVQMRDVNEEGPLHWAARYGEAKITELLLNRDADPMVKGKDDNTPLHIAAIMGQKEVAKVLLAKKAKIEEKGHVGGTPLHHAVSYGQKEMVELLLDKQANIEAKSVNGRTPLHFAAREGKTEVAELLLHKKANIEAKCNIGGTPLHLATCHEQKEMAKLLLDKQASIEAKCVDGRTPLHNAASLGHKDMAELLLDRQANIEAKNKNGDTPLFEATCTGQVKVVELLLGQQASVQAKNNGGNTPLHIAAWAGDIEVASLLLDQGASTAEKCNHNKTPLDDADYRRHKAVLMLLINRGAANDDEKGRLMREYNVKC